MEEDVKFIGKKFLERFFHLLGLTLVCTCFLAFPPLLYIGLSRDFNFSCCQFDALAPWLALALVFPGFILSMFFRKKRLRRFFTALL